jgi:hypothetical protein
MLAHQHIGDSSNGDVKVSGGGRRRLCFWLEADGHTKDGDTDGACARVANLALSSLPLKALS